MRVIGITGGVGAGKTSILNYLGLHYNCHILQADQVAKLLQEPGTACYGQLVDLLGRAVLDRDGRIDRRKMAEQIFGDASLLEAVNAIVHPAVRTYILSCIREEREKGEKDFFFLEAALLIECGYEDIVEEMWYIDTKESLRRERLRESRNYTDEKIDGILRAQLDDETYRAHCGFVIDNSGEAASTWEQIDRKMGEYMWKK